MSGGTAVSTTGRDYGIDLVKCLMLILLPLFHCRILPPEDTAAFSQPGGILLTALVDWWPGIFLARSFFFLSGYLFFMKTDTLTPQSYAAKLKSRIRSLLVPYLIWNTICACLIIGKALVFGNNLFDIITDGHISWTALIQGYWDIPGDGPANAPYAFAYWFLRNLIVFIVLSPLAMLIGRYTLLTVLYALAVILLDLHDHLFLYFVAGAFFAIHKIRFVKLRPLVAVAILAVSLSLSIIERMHDWPAPLSLSMAALSMAFAFMGMYSLLSRVNGTGKVWKYLMSSAFFVYSFHQCFSSTIRDAVSQLIHPEQVWQYTLATAVATLMLLALTFGVYAAARRFTPRLLNISCGGR